MWWMMRRGIYYGFDQQVYREMASNAVLIVDFVL
jgi:tRNA G37 N-methylase TrmD